MLDDLYENIGNKIKKWAKWIFVVEAIVAIISGIFLCTDGDNYILWGFILIVAGPIVAFVSTWILYAFGQLVDDVHAMRNKEGTTAEVKAKLEAEEKAKREAELKAKREAELKAKREAEEKAKCETEENTESFHADPSKTVVPNKYKDYYSCPKCGCTLKFGQKECLCSWQMDWSEYV